MWCFLQILRTGWFLLFWVVKSWIYWKILRAQKFGHPKGGFQGISSWWRHQIFKVLSDLIIQLYNRNKSCQKCHFKQQKDKLLLGRRCLIFSHTYVYVFLNVNISNYYYYISFYLHDALQAFYFHPAIIVLFFGCMAQ